MSAKIELALVSVIIIVASLALASAHSHTYDVASNQQQQQQPAAGKIEPSADLVPINPRPKRHSHVARSYIDLTHILNNQTIHWPTNNGVSYTVQRDGKEGTDQYIKSDSISMAIHSGTHLDAPRHFGEGNKTVEMIPLERLYDVPVTVIDVEKKVKANRTYNFVVADFKDSTGKSLVKPNTVVLVYTGISDFYKLGETRYYGTNDTKNASSMLIPGFSKEAAEFLVKEGVYGVGLDAPSADSSDKHKSNGTFDAVAHRTFNKNEVFILENVGPKLKELIGKPANLIISTLPIETASGSPVRLVAYKCVDDECDHAHNSASSVSSFKIITGLSLVLGFAALLL